MILDHKNNFRNWFTQHYLNENQKSAPRFCKSNSCWLERLSIGLVQHQMTLIIVFHLDNDLGASILFHKWILSDRIIWKSGITLLSRHIDSKVAFSSILGMLIICQIAIMQIRKKFPKVAIVATKLNFFNTPIDSGSTIKPCTLKHFQVPILAPGLYTYHMQIILAEFVMHIS